MNATPTRTANLGLHACCGPCALMPVKELRAAGFEPRIFFCNPNIAPEAEYRRRLATLKTWAEDEGVAVEEVKVSHARWVEAVAKPYEERQAAGDNSEQSRRERCRQCYRLRFEAVCTPCRRAGVPVLSTTLSVSPYQYTDIIAEELAAAARKAGLISHFADFRPLYPEATRKAIELGLYRQNYCGCELSAIEAEVERHARQDARRAARLARREATKDERLAQEQARQEKAKQRQAYEQKRAHQREVLRSLRGLT